MTASGPPPPPPRQPAGGPPASNDKFRLTPRQVVGAILVVVILVFIFENTDKVEVRLIIPQVKLPLYLALLIAAVLGGLITLLLQYRRHRTKQQ